MTKVNLIRVIKIIGEKGRKVGIPLENIKQAVSWAKEKYAGLEIEQLANGISSVFSRKYEDAVSKVLDNDPLLESFVKENGLHILHSANSRKIIEGVAYRSMAAVALGDSCRYIYSNRVKDFWDEAVLFELPGTSALYLDEVEKVLEKRT